jgi:dihydropteroate synthase
VTRAYWRPVIGAADGDALPLAGGPLRFAHAQQLERGRPPMMVPASAIPDDVLARLTAPRRLPVAPRSAGWPLVMGILNTTPDSFSDGGRHLAADTALAAAAEMAAAGADIIDVGAESTRPGAAAVSEACELARLAPLWPGLAALPVPLSVDTRKSAVMAAGLAAGAAIINDVSALTHDAAAAAVVAGAGAWAVLMHHQGTPATMQAAPRYDDVLLDVFDWLEGRIAAAVAAGIPRERLIIDPGIGFGKTAAHNLALVRGLALLHGLGLPILFGASRKSLISHVAGDVPVDQRLPGSLALALAAAGQGVQLLRVHDVAATVQALALSMAVNPALP